MKILQVHDEHVFRGGEEIVCDLEYKVLSDKGHAVRRFLASPVPELSLKDKLKLMKRFLYNRDIKEEIKREIREFKPDIVHVHNYFPTLTPSVFDACREVGVPGIMTLHNFRFMVPDGKLRKGEQGRPFFLLGLKQVFNRSYRDSFFYSFSTFLMILYNRFRRTWHKKVDAFIIPSAWMKDIFVRFGINESKLHLKHHFVEDPLDEAEGLNLESRTGYVYVGRLSNEKGILPLVRFWKDYGNDLPLTIVGTGPQEEEVKRHIENNGNICLEGFKDRNKLQRFLSGFKAIISTSQNHESFGLVIIEAFSAGTPVIAPDLKAFNELIDHGETGFLFDLDNIRQILPYLEKLEKDKDLARRMCRNARVTYLKKYAPDTHYNRYMEIVRQVLINK